MKNASKMILKMILKIYNFLVILVYPNRCFLCEEILPLESESDYICTCCAQEIKLYDGIQEERIKAVYEYRGKIKRMIHRFKFRFHPEYGDFAAEILLNDLSPDLGIDFKNYDCIVPVPVYIKRMKKRGFNQSELIARGIAKRTGIEVCAGELIRTRNTEAQLGLSSRKRAENVKDAFKVVKSGYFKDKKIILFDDICTTGSTIKECIKTIENDGCAQIVALCLSKVGGIKEE